ncbi:hypothetical protein Micbo1qcDRAFT_195898 [Microdochium bolleyi]|uniref:Uncharacterized protein n=1 Tax=Microdochium bolleyi TaxID=196109 RepID=A0A136J279_9PEZI|nr:hypothetical protein Micbo1qcDRAFT_195898 [Microdochium bolleyi]
MDGLNDYRAARVAEILSDFRTLQYYIAAAPVNPDNQADYWTDGWALLRQCAIDGQHILNCAADVSVPQTIGGEAEQDLAELKQVLLDAFARRHVAQMIYLRQAAAQRWVTYRDQVMQSQQSPSGLRRALEACDDQLRSDLEHITDESIHSELRTADVQMGRWTAEDPSVRAVQRWVRARPATM